MRAFLVLGVLSAANVAAGNVAVGAGLGIAAALVFVGSWFEKPRTY